MNSQSSDTDSEIVPLLQLPNFKGWLEEHETNKYLCRCKACGVDLRSGKSELEKHSATAKHNKISKNLQDFKRSDNFLMEVQSQRVATAEIELANFFAHHNVAFEIVEHFCNSTRALHTSLNGKRFKIRSFKNNEHN